MYVWPKQCFCLCRMVFIKLLFLSTMSKTSCLDWCSVQLIFINLLQIHISNDSSRWMSTFLNYVHVSAAYNMYSKSESLLFISLTLTSSFLSVILLVYWMLLFKWLFNVLLPHNIMLQSSVIALPKYTNCRTSSTLWPFTVIIIFFLPVLRTLITFVCLMLIFIQSFDVMISASVILCSLALLLDTIAWSSANRTAFALFTRGPILKSS